MSRALRVFAALAALFFIVPAFADSRMAVVVGDLTPLRPAPRDSAKPHALLWQGEALEVRGERMDYLQVYDHRLERGGYVSAKLVRRVSDRPSVRAGTPHGASLPSRDAGLRGAGIGYAALYIQAAPAQALRAAGGAEALDALGTLAERLARRASSGTATTPAAQAALSGHLEVAMSYGVVFTSVERDTRVVICYDGDGFRRLVDMGNGDAAQRAHAVLSLTRSDCADSDVKPTERRAADASRADLLETVDVSELPPYLRNRVHMRRAVAWNSVAFHSARRGEPAQSAAARALQELGSVDKQELTDEDQRAYADAAMRVNASRWAAIAQARVVPVPESGDRPHLVLAGSQPGETCVLLVDAKHEAAKNSRSAAPTASSGKAPPRSIAKAMRSRSRCSIPRHGGRCGSFARRASNGLSPRFRLQLRRPVSDTRSSQDGCPAAGKSSWRAKRPARASTARASSLCASTRSCPWDRCRTPQLLPAFQRWQDASWKQASLSLR